VETRRRIDLCTCGKPREHSAHNAERFRLGAIDAHGFMPLPQPPPLPADATVAHRIIATCIDNSWRATVMAPGGARGNGQASSWILAVEAALEDLKEKS
jgi:hypothetical protein